MFVDASNPSAAQHPCQSAPVGATAAMAARVGQLGVILLVASCCKQNYKMPHEQVCLASLSNGGTFCQEIKASYAAEFKLADRSLLELEAKVTAMEQMSATLDDSQRDELLHLRKTLDRTKTGLAGAAWSGDSTSFEAFGKDLAHLKHATLVAEASIPRVGFGLTRPYKLIYFQAEPFASAGTSPPAMCARDRILRELEGWVRKDAACKATSVTDGDWNQELLEANCTVVRHPQGCEDRYVAWIWREDVKASESDYRLYGYSRLGQECPNGENSGPTEQATTKARGKNEELFKFLGQCERSP